MYQGVFVNALVVSVLDGTGKQSGAARPASDDLRQPLLHKLPHLLLQGFRGGGVEDFDLVGEHEVVPAEGAEAVDGGGEDPVGVIFLVELVFGEMAGAGEVLDEVVVGHHVQPEADGIVVVLVYPTEDIGLAGLEVVVVFRVGDVGVHLGDAGEVELLELPVFQIEAPHFLVVIEEVDGHHEPVADLAAVAAGVPAEVHLVFLVDGFLQPDQVGDVPVHALEAHQAPALAFLRHRQGLVAVADVGGSFGPRAVLVQVRDLVFRRFHGDADGIRVLGGFDGDVVLQGVLEIDLLLLLEEEDEMVDGIGLRDRVPEQPEAAGFDPVVVGDEPGHVPVQAAALSGNGIAGIIHAQEEDAAGRVQEAAHGFEHLAAALVVQVGPAAVVPHHIGGLELHLVAFAEAVLARDAGAGGAESVLHAQQVAHAPADGVGFDRNDVGLFAGRLGGCEQMGDPAGNAGLPKEGLRGRLGIQAGDFRRRIVHGADRLSLGVQDLPLEDVGPAGQLVRKGLVLHGFRQEAGGEERAVTLQGADGGELFQFLQQFHDPLRAVRPGFGLRRRFDLDERFQETLFVEGLYGPAGAAGFVHIDIDVEVLLAELDADHVQDGLVVGLIPFPDPGDPEETAGGHPEDALLALFDIQDATLEEQIVAAGAFRALDGEGPVGLPDGDPRTVRIGLHACACDEVVRVQIGEEVPDIGPGDQVVVEEWHLLRIFPDRLAPEVAIGILADVRDGHPVSLREGFPPGDDAALRLHEFLGEIAQQVRLVPLCRLEAFFLDIPGGDLHFPVRHGEGDGAVFRQIGRRNGDNAVLAGHVTFPGVGERGDGSVPS